MRDLESIMSEMFASLVQSGSALSDFTPQGVAYTLVRSFATSLQQLELQHELALEALDFRIATGANLEAFCIPFGILRQGAHASTGWALITANIDLTLAANTVLTELNSGQQYLINSNSNVLLKAFIETPVQITATGIGAGYDLVAGTRLYTSTPQISSTVVGYERKYDGTACGDLAGGQRAESDDSLRGRWYSLLRAGGLFTTDVVRTLVIQHPQVVDAIVTTPQPGVVLVIVRALEQADSLIIDVQNLVQSYLIGATVKVELAKATPITVEVSVTPLPAVDLNQIKLDITNITTSYINNARLTNCFNPIELQANLSSVGQRVEITLPTETFSWGALTFIELGSLYVNFRL